MKSDISRFNVLVSTNNHKVPSIQLPIGTLARREGYGIVLRHYDGWVCLDNPRHTWHSDNKEPVEVLPPGSIITLQRAD